MSNYLAGREAQCRRIEQAVDTLNGGSGGVLFVAAEAGMGKSALLDWTSAMITARGEPTVVRVDCRPPIGSINTSALQPLQPFGIAIDKLFLQSGQAARKRLALNIGMSVLASIPIAGDLFYAVKAISQDVNEYKRDTAASQQKKRSAVVECLETLQTIADKTPFVLLVDDGQWADSQSVEVLRQLIQGLTGVPLLIVWAVTPSSARHGNLALATIIRSESDNGKVLELSPLLPEHVIDAARSIAPSASLPPRVVDVLFERSAGNPGIIVEYMKFLQSAGHISDDGSVDERAFDAMRLTASDHPATDVLLHDISEDDAVILSLCSAEGREFTAFLQAALMNTDVLNVIRTLRRISLSTSLIRSVGMQTRYGVRTTVYEFVQAFPYTYFLHRPEYEERKNIHQRIADILSREYSNTPIAELRNQLAADIAAHGAEAEDTHVVERMLTQSASNADSIGAPEISSYIRNELLPQYTSPDIELQDAGDEPLASSANSYDALPVLNNTVREISDLIVSGRAVEARSRALRLLETHPALSMHEQIVLTCLAARACTDREMYDDAAVLLRGLDSITNVSPSDQCLIMNAQAVLALFTDKAEEAARILFEAARLAEGLNVASKAMTLANIVIYMRNADVGHLDRYERSMIRLSSAHSWYGLRTDLGLPS